MAKASQTGATLYLAEGQDVPPADEVQGVRLVGPGAPVPDEAVAEPGMPSSVPDNEAVSRETAELPAPVRPNVNAPKADWVTYAVGVDDTLTYEEADDLTKAELVDRYGR